MYYICTIQVVPLDSTPTTAVVAVTSLLPLPSTAASTVTSTVVFVFSFFFLFLAVFKRACNLDLMSLETGTVASGSGDSVDVGTTVG